MTPIPEYDDQQLRAVLHDAVADVVPRDGLAAIRERVSPSPVLARRRWPIAVAAAAAVVLVVGGVIGVAATLAGRGPGGATPSGSTATTVHTRTLPLYFVGDAAGGRRLFLEPHRLGVTGDNGAQVAMDALLGGFGDAGQTLAFPRGTTATVTVRAPDRVEVDLSDAGPRLATSEAQLRIQSVVWTVDAVLGDDAAVRFLVDGQPARTVLGYDVDRGWVERTADVLAPVQIDTPAANTTVSGTFTVSGEASADEADVVWELRQGATVVKKGFTTAEECCTLSPYSFTVRDVPPGSYTLVVHDTDDSDGEGVGVTRATRTVVVG